MGSCVTLPGNPADSCRLAQKSKHWEEVSLKEDVEEPPAMDVLNESTGTVVRRPLKVHPFNSKHAVGMASIKPHAARPSGAV